MSSGYEQIYESLIPKLSKCDFIEVSERFGLSLQQEGVLSADFLGREYEISFRGVNPTGGKPVNVNNLSVLAYYTLSEGDEEFPCEVQILFDKNASCFMEFECLAFLEGCLVRAMVMTAQTGEAAGWV